MLVGSDGTQDLHRAAHHSATHTTPQPSKQHHQRVMMVTPTIVTTTTISHVSQSGRLRTASCSSLSSCMGNLQAGTHEGMLM
ncbi:hypothetical protein HMPREF9621_02902 [Cutibacterium modestum HL037PA2]|nr:hypothetical protein HMPREF9621_02902 [Cutibacterium modestum HL037PA2]